MRLGALGPLAHAHAGPTAKTHERSGRDARLNFEWSLSWVEVQGLTDAAVQRRVNRALLREAVRERAEMRRDLRGWESSADYPSDLSVGMFVGLLTPELLSVSISAEPKPKPRCCVAERRNRLSSRSSGVSESRLLAVRVTPLSSRTRWV